MPVYDTPGLGRATQRGYVWSPDSPVRAGGYPALSIAGGSATPGASIGSPSPSAPIVSSSAGRIAAGAQAIIDKLRKENAELSNRIRAMAKGGATGAQLAQRDQLITKLRGDVATLTQRIRSGAAGGGASAQQLAAANATITKLRGDVATLTRTIQTAGQPPAPGTPGTGLQQLVQSLVRKVQTREAALRSHNIAIPNP